MKPGDKINVEAHKADGTCYRSWEATIEEIGENHLITVAPAGSLVMDAFKGNWNIRYALRSYYWFDKQYNLLEVFSPDNGSLTEIYINIGSLPEIRDDMLHFIDNEIDVSRYPPDKAKIIDEDEFADAIEKYGYSEAFQKEVYRVANECLGIANNWQAREMPLF